MLLFIYKCYRNVSLSGESVMAVLYVGMYPLGLWVLKLSTILSIIHFAFENFHSFDLTVVKAKFSFLYPKNVG